MMELEKMLGAMLRILILVAAVVLTTIASLAQGGSAEKPKQPPKTSPPKTPTKRTTTRTPSPTPRAARRQTAPNIEMVYVQGGTFLMGSPDGVGLDDEHPQHRVTVE